MEKSELVAILKKNGLEVGEEIAMLAVRSVFKAIPEIVLATENKYDDMLVPLLGVVEKPVMALLDQIDGEIG